MTLCPECNQEKLQVQGFPPMCRQCYDEIVKGIRKSKFYENSGPKGGLKLL